MADTRAMPGRCAKRQASISHFQHELHAARRGGRDRNVFGIAIFTFPQGTQETR